jgi:hypothetical protein
MKYVQMLHVLYRVVLYFVREPMGKSWVSCALGEANRMGGMLSLLPYVQIWVRSHTC